MIVHLCIREADDVDVSVTVWESYHGAVRAAWETIGDFWEREVGGLEPMPDDFTVALTVFNHCSEEMQVTVISTEVGP